MEAEDRVSRPLPDAPNVAPGEYEYRLADCRKHPESCAFKRYRVAEPHRCLSCWQEAGRPPLELHEEPTSGVRERPDAHEFGEYPLLEELPPVLRAVDDAWQPPEPTPAEKLRIGAEAVAAVVGIALVAVPGLLVGWGVGALRRELRRFGK
jgi:hypothetical protein